MFCRIPAAAPGVPSASFIIAVLDRRFSTISTASSVTMIPIRIQIQLHMATASTVSAIGIAAAATTSGMNHLSRFAVYEKTIPICFSRVRNETFSCWGAFAMRGILMRRARASGDRIGVEPAGPVRRSHQRPAQHAHEADINGLLAKRDELLWPHSPRHGMVSRGGAEVLGDRQQLAARRVQVAHDLRHLDPFLAETEDQVGFRDQAIGPRGGEHVERAVVPESRP